MRNEQMGKEKLNKSCVLTSGQKPGPANVSKTTVTGRFMLRLSVSWRIFSHCIFTYYSPKKSSSTLRAIAKNISAF